MRADVIIAGRTARFGHPEQSIAIVTLLGGVYRIAERAGRSRAMRWALTSEQVPAEEMERFGVVDRVVDDDALDEEAAAFAARVAAGPTLAHAAHKALLRTWAVGGVAAADEVILDVALPLFDSRRHPHGHPDRGRGRARRPPPPDDAVRGTLTMTDALQVHVHVSPSIPTAVTDLPPDLDVRVWSPIATTILTGAREAVVVDPPLTNDAGPRPPSRGSSRPAAS